MTKFFVFTIFIFSSLLVFDCVCAQNTVNTEIDYTIYHKNIIEAENEIFINGDSLRGLNIFKTTFEQFDFVFVDDCIEAFQLALFFKKEDYAMVFIKKAIANGFDVPLLKYLNLNYRSEGSGQRRYVTIFEDFIKKNRSELEAYTVKCFPLFLSRIDRKIYQRVLQNHVREQLFKNEVRGLCENSKEQNIRYHKIEDDNLFYLDSLAQKGIFLGERNLGCNYDKLSAILGGTTEFYLKKLVSFYMLSFRTTAPINTEDSYFEMSPLYNMLYHNKGSFRKLLKYSDNAIRSGYWHPREWISLKFNSISGEIPNNEDMRLETFWEKIADTRRINEIRSKNLLPSYEIDYAKYEFGAKNNLYLSFGWSHGTR